MTDNEINNEINNEIKRAINERKNEIFIDEENYHSDLESINSSEENIIPKNENENEEEK